MVRHHLNKADRAVLGTELTEIERFVLARMAEGESTKGIARLLGRAPATVMVHRVALFKRLGARNAPHAVALGYQKGLIHVGLSEAA